MSHPLNLHDSTHHTDEVHHVLDSVLLEREPELRIRCQSAENLLPLISGHHLGYPLL